MADSSTTQPVDSASTTGTVLPVNYAYYWATGKRLQYYTLQNTGNHDLDFTRVGCWANGLGEEDGCIEIWNQDRVLWDANAGGTYAFDDTKFHYHSGTHTPLGSGLAPTSSGGDQLVDSFWSMLPTAINPLPYSGVCNYWIAAKLQSLSSINSGQSPDQSNADDWADINPVGLFRGRRVRIFDAYGNQTGYAFSDNPAWCFLDYQLISRVKPEYLLTLSGPDALTAAEIGKFGFESFYAAAQYCAQISATTGRPRFVVRTSFQSQTTMVDVESRLLSSCRGYVQEEAGQLILQVDQQRSPVFVVSRNNKLSLKMDDQQLDASPNQVKGTFRDVLIPAVKSDPVSIAFPNHGQPTVTTESTHPFVAGDFIWIGGTNTNFDGPWQVDPNSTPTDTTFLLVSKGSNYPASWTQPSGQPEADVAKVGLRQSRFAKRSPLFNHKSNQLARGMAGLGLARQLQATPVEIDFGVSTYDQVSRIATYERDKPLGVDTYVNGAFSAPYVPPAAGSVSLELLAQDVNGAIAILVQEGDLIELDDTADFQYAGQYEINEVEIANYSAAASSNGSAARTQGGTVTWTLAPFAGSTNAFYDTYDPDAAGWYNVPDSDPDVNGAYTSIPIVGGTLGFFGGAIPSGAVVQLPASGFPAANFVGWASSQGYIETGNDMHIISDCSLDDNSRIGTNTYEDGENDLWHGDLSYFGAVWISTSVASVTTNIVASSGSAAVAQMSWQEFTLAGAGAEVISLGKGTVPDGGTFSLPPGGYSEVNMIAIAFPCSAPEVTGNHAHGINCQVDGTTVHDQCADSSGNTWSQDSSVLVVAWKNNGGTVTTAASGGTTWVSIPVSGGLTLRFGTAILSDADTATDGFTADNPTAMTLPAGMASSVTMAWITSPRSFHDSGNPAHGVRSNYMDSALTAHIDYGDGETGSGHIWPGDQTVFAVMCE